MAFWNKDVQAVEGSITHSILQLKRLVMLSFKTKIIQKAIEKLPTEYSCSRSVKIKRHPARDFISSGKCDHNGKYTIFGQLFTQCKQDESLLKCFNLN